jgi:hypothetical protein
MNGMSDHENRYISSIGLSCKTLMLNLESNYFPQTTISVHFSMLKMSPFSNLTNVILAAIAFAGVCSAQIGARGWNGAGSYAVFNVAANTSMGVGYGNPRMGLIAGL